MTIRPGEDETTVLKTCLVLARSEPEAWALAPDEVESITVDPGWVTACGEPRIIGWIGERVLVPVRY